MGRFSSLPPFPSLQALAHLLLLRPVLKVFFGASVVGKENLEGLEQFILVANHNSHLDTPFLFHILPLRLIPRTHPVGALDYFGKTKILFRVAEFLFQPVWIVRGAKGAGSLEGMRERLRAGHSVIIFPEGTRGIPGELARFRGGVGLLAAEFREVPIVPVFLSGVERALPRSSSLPLPTWTRITVGLPQLFQGRSKDITASLEGMVRELSEAEGTGRHQRVVRPREIPTIAVLGIDGSGKSTLSRALARRLSETGRVCLLTDDVVFFEEGEPQELQPLVTEKLREAIGRRAKTAESLKSYKIPKVAELLLRDQVLGQVKRWYTPDLIVSDGCPLLNITAWVRLYRKEEPEDGVLASAMRILSGCEEVGSDDPAYEAFPELMAMKRLRIPKLRRPEAALFLDVDPALSVQRIQSRGETRQVHETLEKLERLREGYLSVCRILEGQLGIPAEILDGNMGMDEVTAAALEAVAGMGVLPQGMEAPKDSPLNPPGG
ncbi:MAG: 1-acyl-sn-glycerol-3-phosphate acyltransferase [Gemmatimonadota bacterium]